VELPFRINFSAKQKVERLRIPHHLKAAGRYRQCTQKQKKMTADEYLKQIIAKKRLRILP
jgi:hypothetical protein